MPGPPVRLGGGRGTGAGTATRGTSLTARQRAVGAAENDLERGGGVQDGVRGELADHQAQDHRGVGGPHGVVRPS